MQHISLTIKIQLKWAKESKLSLIIKQMLCVVVEEGWALETGRGEAHLYMSNGFQSPFLSWKIFFASSCRDFWLLQNISEIHVLLWKTLIVSNVLSHCCVTTPKIIFSMQHCLPHWHRCLSVSSEWFCLFLIMMWAQVFGGGGLFRAPQCLRHIKQRRQFPVSLASDYHQASDVLSTPLQQLLPLPRHFSMEWREVEEAAAAEQ